jgi:hypothetical protein
MRKWWKTITVAAVMVGWSGPAVAATDAEKCEAAKLKIAGKYGFCRLKAEAKAVKTGDPPDHAKCDEKYGEKWTAAEGLGGGMCPTNGDQSAVQTFVTQHSDDLAAALAGGTLPNCPADLATCSAGLAQCQTDLAAALSCGNAVLDPGEDCELSTLNGQT